MVGKVKNAPLFIGLTRPPMLLGASLTFSILNVSISSLGFLISSSIYFIAIGIPLQILGYYLCSKEPLIIELIRVRLNKCSRSQNRLVHGANSYDPF